VCVEMWRLIAFGSGDGKSLKCLEYRFELSHTTSKNAVKWGLRLLMWGFGGVDRGNSICGGVV
jgi:hypothetical protein